MKQSFEFMFWCFLREIENTDFKGKLNSCHFSLGEKTNIKRNTKNAKGNTVSKTVQYFYILRNAKFKMF